MVQLGGGWESKPSTEAFVIYLLTPHPGPGLTMELTPGCVHRPCLVILLVVPLTRGYSVTELDDNEQSVCCFVPWRASPLLWEAVIVVVVAGSLLEFSVLREVEKHQFPGPTPCFPGDHSFGDCLCCLHHPTPTPGTLPSPSPCILKPQSTSWVQVLSLLQQGHGSWLPFIWSSWGTCGRGDLARQTLHRSPGPWGSTSSWGRGSLLCKTETGTSL